MLDTLRRDAGSVARRVEMIVAVENSTDRPAWLPAFRARFDKFLTDGESKGINFSFSVAIEMAGRMVFTAVDADERGNALYLLGIALLSLGQRERGTVRLEEAVTAFCEALQEWTRDHAPLAWAMTQNNLGNALRTLGEREGRTSRLEEAA
jgi:hypothetical protein